MRLECAYTRSVARDSKCAHSRRFRAPPEYRGAVPSAAHEKAVTKSRVETRTEQAPTTLPQQPNYGSNMRVVECLPKGISPGEGPETCSAPIGRLNGHGMQFVTGAVMHEL